MRITRWLLVLSMLAGFAIQTRGDSIPGLFNTGVTSQTPLVLNAEGNVDPHYTLTLSGDPAYPGPATYVVGPLCCWIANGPNSQWIAPRPDSWTQNTDNNVGGQYSYRLTFDLTGFDPNTASITGQWATDNPGGPILLNGVSTSFTTGFVDFTKWTPFTIDSGFVPGVNTLDFPVFNLGGYPNPTGLRVEFLSSTVTPVPEPSSLMLIGGGAIALFGVIRRKLWR